MTSCVPTVIGHERIYVTPDANVVKWQTHPPQNRARQLEGSIPSVGTFEKATLGSVSWWCRYLQLSGPIIAQEK